ncbi:MAG: PAS domain-containing protein, partial [Deltaproteobacteria bacterium]|nr:PAS domain-containing protein [Deltaproteobacteria bacterium]
AMDCVRDMVISTDRNHRILRCNRPFRQFVGREFQDIIGGNLEEVLREKEISVDLAAVRDTEVCQGKNERWFHIRSHPFTCSPDKVLPSDVESYGGNVVTLHDITERMRIIEEIGVKNAELTDACRDLKRSQAQILQQEKMASIGQLAAGVAHEINNPMGFISSNLRTLFKYVERLMGFIDLQDSALKEAAGPPEPVRKARADAKIDRIQGDIRALLLESIDGAERVMKIVQNLKSFSHVDQAEFMHADINECLNSTINIAWNEIKYKATLSKELGEIPRTKCYPQQINQVLMNILINASHAIEKQGKIDVRSRVEDGCVCVSISDTGGGIPPENLERIFEPFFTTKDVGKGTGLGLSIAYDIVKKHNGEILVESEIGKGTTFTVRIPLVEPI